MYNGTGLKQSILVDGEQIMELKLEFLFYAGKRPGLMTGASSSSQIKQSLCLSLKNPGGVTTSITTTVILIPDQHIFFKINNKKYY